MPQPLSRVREISSSKWGDGALAERPELTVFAMRIMACMAHVEVSFGQMLAGFLGADEPVGTAMYLSLIGAREAALRGAADVALADDPEGKDLFDTVLKAIKPSQRVSSWLLGYLGRIA